MSNDNYPPGSDTPDAPWNEREPSESVVRAAEDSVVDDYICSEFLCEVSKDAKPSSVFGLVSDADLLTKLFSTALTSQQRGDVALELRCRFLATKWAALTVQERVREYDQE